MITVENLIEKLQQMPKDALVAVYADVSEDSDMPNKVELLSKEEGPYNKSSDVWIMYDLPEDENIVFIM